LEGLQIRTGNPNCEGSVLIKLLVLISFAVDNVHFFTKTSYLNAEVNCTEPSLQLTFRDPYRNSIVPLTWEY
jgi:hypothetical protein